MGASKLNTISDPLGQQKTAAENQGLQNYGVASQAVPGLHNFYNTNFGQSAQTTLGNMDPLFQQTYGSVQGDVTGQGGPFTSLNKNLLGAFDTQANQAQASQNAQLQSEGLYGSGLGFGANNDLQSKLAQQRGLISAQTGIQELSFADQLSQQLMQQNQLMGFQDPMAALQQIFSLSNPPNFQNVENTTYTPAPKSTGFQNAFSDVLAAANTAAGFMGGGGGGGGAAKQSYMPFGMNPQKYNPQTLMNTPGLQFSSM